MSKIRKIPEIHEKFPQNYPRIQYFPIQKCPLKNNDVSECFFGGKSNFYSFSPKSTSLFAF